MRGITLVAVDCIGVILVIRGPPIGRVMSKPRLTSHVEME